MEYLTGFLQNQNGKGIYLLLKLLVFYSVHISSIHPGIGFVISEYFNHLSYDNLYLY